MKRNTRGFTLIELLVVIAIIGILASVVLVSLQSARKKGNDASIQTELSSLRSQAEIYYSNNNSSYDLLFTGNAAAFANTSFSGNSDVNAIMLGVKKNTTALDGISSATGWAVRAYLPSTTNTYFCVDSSGAARNVTSTLNGVSCPAN